MGWLLEADDSQHPGLHPTAAEWITAATSLGLRFLRAPRVAAPRPPVVRANFAVESGEQYRERLRRFKQTVSAIEARGVGMARIRAIGERIKKRKGSTGSWYSALADAQNDQEHREIEAASREWADADAIAAHIAYGNDLFCSGDRARNTGAPSILDVTNRTWLRETYGTRIVSLEELAAELNG